MKQLIIGSIEDQGDRVLLHPADDAQVTRDVGVARMVTPVNTLGGYYVITSHEQAANLTEGDTIEYEPYGVNFGWFSRAL